MQQFITSNKFQDPLRLKPRYSKEPDVLVPSSEVIRNILAYAAALKVFKTKSVGDLHVLMN